MFDGGKGFVQYSGDQVGRERGFRSAELPGGCAERFDLFQVEFHQTFLAGGMEAGVHEDGGRPVCAFGAEAKAFPEEGFDAFQRAVRVAMAQVSTSLERRKASSVMVASRTAEESKYWLFAAG